jgi:hypothetical protein
MRSRGGGDGPAVEDLAGSLLMKYLEEARARTHALAHADMLALECELTNMRTLTHARTRLNERSRACAYACARDRVQREQLHATVANLEAQISAGA